jgi:hypothetical protein
LRRDGEIAVTLAGEIGHTVESCKDGTLLKYGPLVLAPQSYFWNSSNQDMEGVAPSGWGGPLMPEGIPTLLLDAPADPRGFLNLKRNPERRWNHYDAGPAARFGIPDAEVAVPVRLGSGKEMELVFTPLCSATSYMVFFETPVVLKQQTRTEPKP